MNRHATEAKTDFIAKVIADAPPEGGARFKLVNQEATRTGLEPATSGSTVRGSNQLSYRANGWTEKYIDTPDTRKAFPRRVFAADFGLVLRFDDCNAAIGNNCGK